MLLAIDVVRDLNCDRMVWLVSLISCDVNRLVGTNDAPHSGVRAPVVQKIIDLLMKLVDVEVEATVLRLEFRWGSCLPLH